MSRTARPYNIPPKVAAARSRLAGLAAAGAAPEEIAAARAELNDANTEAAIDAAVDRLIAKAQPLTPEQRARLAALLAAS